MAAISTAGIIVSYGATYAAKKKIPGVTEIPELNPAPESLETTELAETDYKTYIPGLKDLGGALSFTVNFEQDFIDAYEELLEAQESAAQKLFIDIPDIDKHLEVDGVFSELGMPGASVNQVLTGSFHFTPSAAPKWVGK
jgi:hypothetical protein